MEHLLNMSIQYMNSKAVLELKIYFRKFQKLSNSVDFEHVLVSHITG